MKRFFFIISLLFLSSCSIVDEFFSVDSVSSIDVKNSSYADVGPENIKESAII